MQKDLLMIVVRDYGFLGRSKFGLHIEAGKKYIEKLLRDSPNDTPQHRLMKSYLKSNFGEIECSLLPRPNSVVANESCSVSG